MAHQVRPRLHLTYISTFQARPSTRRLATEAPGIGSSECFTFRCANRRLLMYDHRLRMQLQFWGQLISICLLMTLTGFAQSASTNVPPVDYETARFSRVVRAIPVEEEITIDGRLDEEAWQRAEPARDFTQSGRSPNPGYPASQLTEVRFLYDTENLYVGAICWEKDVANMIVNGLKRDYQTNQGDEVGLMLDSLNDDRSGFFFGTNPAGARRDLQVANDSQANTDWDGVWDVRVSLEEDRWVAEFVIPFKTLRFSSSPSQEWGLNLFRKLRRANEESNWAPLPRRYNMTRISVAGTLTGLEGISQGRNLKVKPFAVAGFTQQRSGDDLETNFDPDGGFDAKYGLTQSLTLDATFRTDFSQSEVDQDQVNLTRFNLFFPEKREFFLENAGVFGFGGRRAATFGRGGGANLIPFFSRRIGLSPSGTPIPIIGGARVSGTAGSYDIGFLAMKTESEGGIPSNNFEVGRVKKNLLNNSFVGAIITSRDSPVPGDYNRVYGADAVFQFYNRLDISGYILQSDSPDTAGQNQARKFAVGWRDDTVSFGADYEKVEDDFNPEMGFIRRDDNSHYSSDFSFLPRFDSSDLVRNMSFRTNYDYWAGLTGEIETREHDMTLGVTFENSASMNFATTETFERLSEEFSRYSIPIGDYKFRNYSISYNSDRSRLVGGRINYNWGDFWNGTRRSIGGDVTLKPSYHWQIDTSYSRNDIQVPAGDFVTTLVGVKVLYAFNSRAFLNTFVQYNAERNQFTINIRFNLIHRPLSDIFVVFNERRDTVTGNVLDRGVVIKFTNLFDF